MNVGPLCNYTSSTQYFGSILAGVIEGDGLPSKDKLILDIMPFALTVEHEYLVIIILTTGNALWTDVIIFGHHNRGGGSTRWNWLTDFGFYTILTIGKGNRSGSKLFKLLFIRTIGYIK